MTAGNSVDGIDRAHSSVPMWRFFVYSLVGGFVFFVPIDIGGQRSIPLDHLVTAVESTLPEVVPYYALALIAAGAGYPLVNGTWRHSAIDVAFTGCKLIGLVVGVLLVFDVGPAWLVEPSMGPFLFSELVVPVSVLVPAGAIFLALLVSYGFLEFIGVLVRPVMRPVWTTPGRSAVDAVASFVGSYSLSLLITDRMYREGKYTGREAAIIATGFSTVSATFMVVIATTLDLMRMWNLYFWTALVVTFAVTAITVRIRPLSRIQDSYSPTATPLPEKPVHGNRFALAWRAAREVVATAPPLITNIGRSLKDGMLMTMAILPSILSIGLAGLVLATHTPLFDWLGYLFYPMTWLLPLPEPLLVAKALSVGIAEMFLPSLLAASTPVTVKFVIAVVSVAQIVFFSALVPCVAATRIPISISKLVVIWFQRVVLSVLLTTPVALLLL